MSIIRARAYLSELTNKEAPSLSIERNSAGDDSYDWKRNDSATNIQTVCMRVCVFRFAKQINSRYLFREMHEKMPIISTISLKIRINSTTLISFEIYVLALNLSLNNESFYQ